MERPIDSGAPDVDPRIEAAVVVFLQAQDSGHPLDPDTWIPSQPFEIQPALRDFLSVMGLLATPSSVQPRPKREVPHTLPDWGRYVGLHLVGVGGMGAVYSATDTLLGRVVAVKVLHSDLAADGGKAARFLDEARIASQLQHPNIVPVYDYGMMPGQPDRPFFTMRLVAPRTLSETVGEYHLNPSDAGRDILLRQFIAVCGAVAYAHDRGVLHRDLKPQNVMVGAFGEVQVMDWGLSKTLLGVGDTPNVPVLVDPVAVIGSGESVTGVVRGTLAYMPPEQAKGEPIGPAADVFALGGILCYIFTNCPIYSATNPAEQLRSTRECDTKAALDRLLATDAPAELIDLVRRCLARDVTERPGSVALVSAGVSDYLSSADQRLREAEVSRGRAQERAAGERKRRHWQLTVVAISFALIFSAVATGIWYHFDRQARRLEDEAKARELELKETLDREEREREEQRQNGDRENGVAVALNEVYAEIEKDRLNNAAAALRQAKGRLGLDPPSHLVALVAETERNYTAAVNLDSIRQERGVLRAGSKLPESAALQRYVVQFAALGFDPAQPGTGARIRTSPIRLSLLAALDDWAVSEFNTEKRNALLSLAREVDSDSVWGNRFREPNVRADPAQIVAFATQAPIENLSIGQIEALVNALPQNEFIAVRIIRVAEARHPNDFWVNLTAAKRLANTKTPDFEANQNLHREAIGYARTAAALRPDSQGAVLLLAELYRNEGRAEDLDDLMTRVEKFGTENWLRSYILALVASARHDYQGAISHLKCAVQALPDEPKLRANLAGLYGMIGEPIVALETIGPVLDRWPNDTFALAIQSAALVQLGRLNEAEKVTRKALALNPLDGYSGVVFAYLLCIRGRLLDAEAIIRDVRPRLDDAVDEIDRDGVRVVLKLARGEATEALSICQRTLRFSQHPNVHLLHGYCLRANGRTHEAIEAFTQVQKLITENKIQPGALMGLQYLTFKVDARGLRQFPEFEDKWTRDGKLPRPNRSQANLEEGRELDMFSKLELLKHGDSLLVKGYAGAAYHMYEIGLPKESFWGDQSHSFLLGTNRINAARAGALTWSCGGSDAVVTTDSLRREALTRTIGWLKEELEDCQRIARREDGDIRTLIDGGSAKVANYRLHIMLMHRDLEPLRNPKLIREMPEQDQKAAKSLWADVDELYKKLNPPLDIPGLDKKGLHAP